MKNDIILKRISLILLVLIFIITTVFVIKLITDSQSKASDFVHKEPQYNSGVSLMGEITTVPEGMTVAAENTDNQKGYIALAAGIAIGLASLGGAIGMGIAIAKSNESIARQPEMKNDIRSGMMLGLVFIETAIIYALIVSILVIFVL